MLARCLSASLQGLEARPVVVEVDLAPGLPGIQQGQTSVSACFVVMLNPRNTKARGAWGSAVSWCTPARIQRARQRMQQRNPTGTSNGRLSAAALQGSGLIEAAGLELWEQLIHQRGLSTRSSIQLLRVARTIADLNDQITVDRNAVAEASCYRCTDLLKQPGA